MRQRIIMCLCITQGEAETWAENGRASILFSLHFSEGKGLEVLRL